MPKLNPCTPRKALKKLKRAGFIETHQRGSHLYLEDKEGNIVCVPIHGGKEIPIGTLANIVLRQAYLSVEEFNNLGGWI